MIEITELSKIYRLSKDTEVKALNHVSLSVGDGEFLAIMGPSGSGKTTLLHIIGGVDFPTSGKVVVDHEDVQNLKPSKMAVFRRRKVGIIYQAYNLIPTLTVEENMALPLLLDKRTPKSEEMERILETLDLKDRRRHLPGQLSGGQQQRVAVGRILMEKPSVILADEPTGNLDNANTGEILKVLQKINAAGQTILVVTHDENVGLAAGRSLRMQDGKIVYDSKKGVRV